MDDEWGFPAPMSDPEGRKAELVRDEDGGARLVPKDKIVEGDMEEDGSKDGPSCPFSGG